jgi:hypothetical protein
MCVFLIVFNLLARKLENLCDETVTARQHLGKGARTDDGLGEEVMV